VTRPLMRDSPMTARPFLLVVAGSAMWLMAGCDRMGGGAPDAVYPPAAAAETPADSTAPAAGARVVSGPPGAPPFKQLRVAPGRLQNIVTDEVIAPGRIGVNPNRVSRVLPPVQGRVLEVMVKLGDFVERGQPMLSLDSPDADAAVSTYLQAEATDRQVKFALARAETAFQPAKE